MTRPDLAERAPLTILRSMRAGDVDYEAHGKGYAFVRRPDPRIAATIHAVLGEARTVLNVGAGAGSYEPPERHVVALEPSATMRAQRPRHLAPAVVGRAEALPFDDGAFDAAMATITVHQWQDLEKGLTELRRVTRGPIVILTFDPQRMQRFWLAEYAPALIAVEARRQPALERLSRALGPIDTHEVPIPVDCTDGFTEAFYGRPEALLDPAVRAAQSSWGFLEAGEPPRIVERLAADLKSGVWDARHGALRTQPTFVGSLVLVVAR